MNTFKKEKFWLLPLMVGMFLAVFGGKQIHNGTAANIVQMYVLIIRDAIVMGLILPSMALLCLREADGFMTGRRMLAINSRGVWWKTFCRKVFTDCFFLAVVILLPALFTAVFLGGAGASLWEWIYVLFLFLTLYLYFCMASIGMLLLEIKFRQDILSVCFLLAASFLPNIFAFLFRPSGIPDIGSLLNLSFAMDETVFYSGMEKCQGICWFWCVGVCAVFFVLLCVLVRAGRTCIKRQDIFWG